MKTMRFLGIMVATAGLIMSHGSVAWASKKVSCDKVLAASEEAGDSKSPDQIAKKLGTSPTRVRHCMGKTQGGKDPVPVRKQPAPGEPAPKLE